MLAKAWRGAVTVVQTEKTAKVDSRLSVRSEHRFRLSLSLLTPFSLSLSLAFPLALSLSLYLFSHSLRPLFAVSLRFSLHRLFFLGCAWLPASNLTAAAVVVAVLIATSESSQAASSEEAAAVSVASLKHRTRGVKYQRPNTTGSTGVK
jgi:hypothetical protein